MANSKESSLLKNIDYKMTKEEKKAKISIEKEIKLIDSPEVNYFIKNFLPAYEKTLDELD